MVHHLIFVVENVGSLWLLLPPILIFSPKNTFAIVIVFSRWFAHCYNHFLIQVFADTMLKSVSYQHLQATGIECFCYFQCILCRYHHFPCLCRRRIFLNWEYQSFLENKHPEETIFGSSDFIDGFRYLNQLCSCNIFDFGSILGKYQQVSRWWFFKIKIKSWFLLLIANLSNIR